MFNQNVKFHCRAHRLLGSSQSFISIHAFTSFYRSEFRRFGFLVSLNGTIKSGPEFYCGVRLLHSSLHRMWCVRLPKAVGAFSVEISFRHTCDTAVCRLFRFSRTTTATFLCWSGDFDFSFFLSFSLAVRLRFDSRRRGSISIKCGSNGNPCKIQIFQESNKHADNNNSIHR